MRCNLHCSMSHQRARALIVVKSQMLLLYEEKAKAGFWKIRFLPGVMPMLRRINGGTCERNSCKSLLVCFGGSMEGALWGVRRCRSEVK